MSTPIPDTPDEITQFNKPPLEPQPHHRHRHHRKHSWKPRWLRHLLRRVGLRVKLVNVLIITVSFVAVVLVGGFAILSDTRSRVENSLESLTRILSGIQSRPGTELTLTDFNRLQASLDDVVAVLSRAQSQAALASSFKTVNRDFEAGIAVIDAAQNLALAARTMLTGLQPTLFFLVAGTDDQTIVTRISSGERVVELLRLGRGQFVTANEYLRTARGQVENLDLTGLSANLILTVDDVQGYLSQLEEINGFLMNSSDLLTLALGLEKETSYLILAQNSDELRPSGGYISTYGWLTFRNGRVTGYNYSPTTATSPNPPPDSMVSEVEIPPWWIQYSQPIYAAWDGSWYADFPSTAAMAMWYYDSGGNPQSPVDGVIAIDLVGFQYILEALGSVQLPAYEMVISPENFRTAVYDIRAFGEGELPHKRFVAAIYQQIFDDWQTASTDPEVSTRLLGALLRALQEKHVMLYFSDPNLNDAVNLLGWSGIQSPAADHDYLLVADANLGNKSNSSILRQLTYDVVLQGDGTAQSRVTVAYDYSALVAEQDPAVDPEHHGPLDYNNLLQIFTPKGSELLEADEFVTAPQTVEDDGHTVFTARLRVPYDTTERFQYTYQTVPVVEMLGEYERYRLLVQKQPGTQSQTAAVQVRLPANATIIRAAPEPAANYVLDQPILEFQLMLTTDQWVEIIYAE